jgi:hypothetical protein
MTHTHIGTEDENFEPLAEVTVASGSWATLDFARAGHLANAFYNGAWDTWKVLDRGGFSLWPEPGRHPPDHTDLRPSIAKTGSYSGVLICDDLEVPRQYRGHKLGLLLEALAIQELAGSRRLPVCTPELELDFSGDWRADLLRRKVDKERLGRICAEFGFRRLKTVNRFTMQTKPTSADLYWMPTGRSRFAERNVARLWKEVEDSGPITMQVTWDAETSGYGDRGL